MYRRILVGLDGSMAGRQALEVALELAKTNDAAVTVISVEEKLPAYAATVGEVEATRQQMEKYFHRLQQAALVRARQMGVQLHGVILAGNAAQTIARYADHEGFDLIVLGAAGHGALAGHIGATADRVSELATCSVLIVRKGAANVRVRDAMSRQAKSVEPDTPLSKVVEFLWREGVKAVPVVNSERRVVGIITGGDLLTRGGLDLRLSLKQAMSADEVAAQLHKLEQSGQVAADIMTPKVLTVNGNILLSEAASLMAMQHIKRLPVVDEQGIVIGIISRIDVLRQIAAMGGLDQPTPGIPTGPLHMVRDVMVKDVPTVTRETPLDEVITALVESPFRRVVVIDEVGSVLGLISDRELLDRVEPHARPNVIETLVKRMTRGIEGTQEGPQLRSGQAADIMITPVTVVNDDASIVEAIRLMVVRGVKRLPVVDSVDHLVGMVDRQSLLRAVAGSERTAEEHNESVTNA